MSCPDPSLHIPPTNMEVETRNSKTCVPTCSRANVSVMCWYGSENCRVSRQSQRRICVCLCALCPSRESIYLLLVAVSQIKSFELVWGCFILRSFCLMHSKKNNGRNYFRWCRRCLVCHRDHFLKLKHAWDVYNPSHFFDLHFSEVYHLYLLHDQGCIVQDFGHVTFSTSMFVPSVFAFMWPWCRGISFSGISEVIVLWPGAFGESWPAEI